MIVNKTWVDKSGQNMRYNMWSIIEMVRVKGIETNAIIQLT